MAPPHFAAVDGGSPAAVASPCISALLGLLLAHHPCGTDSMPSGKQVGRGHRSEIGRFIRTYLRQLHASDLLIGRLGQLLQRLGQQLVHQRHQERFLQLGQTSEICGWSASSFLVPLSFDRHGPLGFADECCEYFTAGRRASYQTSDARALGTFGLRASPLQCQASSTAPTALAGWQRSCLLPQ